MPTPEEATHDANVQWLPCPGCSGEIGVPPHWLAHTVACPKCGAIVSISEVERVLWRPPRIAMEARPTSPHGPASLPLPVARRSPIAFAVLTALIALAALIAGFLVGLSVASGNAVRFRPGGGAESTLNSNDSVQRGLAWLAKYQLEDGTWSLKGPYKSGTVDARDLPESATAMALLAFEGAGNTHQRGEYQKQVGKGIKALLRMQGGNGDFFQEGGRSNNWFYSHAQCTIVVCELYRMTKDQDLRRPAEQAIEFLIESQDPELGGWRYLPRSDSDTSVTGWVVMAFQSARMAGLEVPSSVLAKINKYLDKVTEDGSTYSYQVGTEPSATMTAEALLCRQHLGWHRDDPRLVAGGEYLLTHLPRYEDRDVYYWYLATQVMNYMKGKYWSAWDTALRDALINQQEKTGAEKGSWDPLGEHPDRWAGIGQGGRLYTTCMSLCMLAIDKR